MEQRGEGEKRGGEGGEIARGCLVEGSSPNSLKPPLSTVGITNYKELLMNRCTSASIHPDIRH